MTPAKTNGEYVLTSKLCSTNAEQFPEVLKLYVQPGAKVLDMTFGNGVFWKNIPVAAYNVTKNDIDPTRGNEHYDFTALPDSWSESFDCVILDPPYMGVGGIETLKESIDRGYSNKARAKKSGRGISAVRRLYAGGIIQAWKVLKKSGILIVKCMDEVESGQQNFMHVDIMELCRVLGFKKEDLFIYVNKHRPTIRHEKQIHARRNHSYWVVSRRRP